MFELYANNELIGKYPTRELAAQDAFELMIDGVLTYFEIIQVSQN